LLFKQTALNNPILPKLCQLQNKNIVKQHTKRETTSEREKRKRKENLSKKIADDVVKPPAEKIVAVLPQRKPEALPALIKKDEVVKAEDKKDKKKDKKDRRRDSETSTDTEAKDRKHRHHRSDKDKEEGSKAKEGESRV
jgi:hypothetical protein